MKRNQAIIILEYMQCYISVIFITKGCYWGLFDNEGSPGFVRIFNFFLGILGAVFGAILSI